MRAKRIAGSWRSNIIRYRMRDKCSSTSQQHPSDRTPQLFTQACQNLEDQKSAQQRQQAEREAELSDLRALYETQVGTLCGLGLGQAPRQVMTLYHRVCLHGHFCMHGRYILRTLSCGGCGGGCRPSRRRWTRRGGATRWTSDERRRRYVMGEGLRLSQ
jgi:hypothetical protein